MGMPFERLIYDNLFPIIPSNSRDIVYGICKVESL